MDAGLFDVSYTREAVGRTQDGLPCAVVTRESEGRRTEYFLVLRQTGTGPHWFSCGPQKVSNGEVRFFAERKGVRLSHSRLDRALRECAAA